MSLSREKSLSSRQERAIRTLLQAQSLAQAADELGVNRRTLRRWLQQPEFAARLEAVSREVYGQTVSSARAAAEDALRTLRDGMNGRAGKVQVAAAKALLDHLAKIDSRDARIAAKLAAVNRASVNLLLWYTGIVERYVTDQATRAAIKRDFLTLGAPAGEDGH